MKTYINPEYLVERDEKRCIRCKVCVNQCTYDTHFYDEETDTVCSKDENCVNCQRCVTFCPTHALTIKKNPNVSRENANWSMEKIRDVKKQAETGGVILTGMGCDKPEYTYWDRLLLNASQVTNPSIDPLREPMEIRTYLGAKPDRLDFKVENGESVLKTQLTPQLCLDTPIMFSAMSYGAISLNVHESLARAATECGTYWNTGEGGLDKSLYKYGAHTIVQVASGRFGVHSDYLNAGAAVEIKIGQGAKPGIGGHLPGEKVTEHVAKTRMIPQGTDALSPAPQHDIYSIEDLRQLIYALKEATNYQKPISVKIAAVHNAPAIASGMVRAGADIIALRRRQRRNWRSTQSYPRQRGHTHRISHCTGGPAASRRGHTQQRFCGGGWRNPKQRRRHQSHRFGRRRSLHRYFRFDCHRLHCLPTMLHWQVPMGNRDE